MPSQGTSRPPRSAKLRDAGDNNADTGRSIWKFVSRQNACLPHVGWAKQGAHACHRRC